MRPLLGLFVLLYGLVLALNTTAPAIAELAGTRVTATAAGETAVCSAPLGKPPFGGIYSACPANWSGSDGGRLFGPAVREELAGGEAVQAYRYPLFNDYAVLPPSPRDKVAGIVAVLITMLGIMLLVAEKQHAAREQEVAADGTASGAPD